MVARFLVDTAEAQEAFPGVEVAARLGDPGGQKLVFDATHPTHGRIALKIVKPQSGTAQDRALREVQAAAKLRGPAFAVIHNWGQSTVAGTQVIFVMEEFLDGGSLRGVLQTRGRLPVPEAISLAGRLLEALVQVEAAKLVHRDIKPENIMMPAGRVVLIDFGIARHLDLSTLTLDFAPTGPLTPGYAAPEQIRNERAYISVRTDLFALGTLLYETLAGSNPFLAGVSSAAEALHRGLRLDPPRVGTIVPGVPAALDDLIHRCMSKAAHRRPPSAADALAELRQF